MSFDASNAARPVLAALLQGGWGVAATHQSWDPVGNRTATEWLWSPGPTVFGYFSDEESLSPRLIQSLSPVLRRALI